MTDVIGAIRLRQREIMAEIAEHTAAVNALASELSDIASAGRVLARLEGAAESTGAPVSEPRKGQPEPGKGASRTVPQVSHAVTRVDVASGGSDPSRDTGGRHQQPALRTEVALGPVDTHSPEGAHEPGDGSQPSPSVGSSDRADVSIGVTSGERPAQYPVANVGEGADGTKPAASVDPASREDDGADRQRLVSFGLTGEREPGSAEPVSAERDRAPFSADQSSGEDGEGRHRPQAPSVRPATTGKPGGEHRASPPAPRIVSGARLKDRVAAIYAEHPDWTARQIAHVLGDGVNFNSVTTTLTIVRKEAAANRPSAEPAPSSPAPEPTIEPERQPGVALLPARPMPASPGSAVVVTPMRRPPKGTLFYLRNAAGEYLHWSAETMTPDKKQAWKGTEAQLIGCRRNFALARDLIERVVEKEQPRVGI